MQTRLNLWAFCRWLGYRVMPIALLSGLAAYTFAQDRYRTPFSVEVQAEWLQQVFPGADFFGQRTGALWPAFRTESGVQNLIGYAFRSRDFPPEEAGYSAPIDLLVAVDNEFRITGLKILDYSETYLTITGDFLADASLIDQFRNKSIRDPFLLSRDLDGIAGSTVSVFAIARGARDASRRVAEAHLGFNPADPVQQARNERIASLLAETSWADKVDGGSITQLTVASPDGESMLLSFTYIGHPGLGHYWIGSDSYARAEREASRVLGSERMLLLGISGSAADQFLYYQLQAKQDSGGGLSYFRRFTEETFTPLETPDTAAAARHTRSQAAFILPANFDLTQPFTLGYRQLGSEERHTVTMQLQGLELSLANGEDVLSEQEIEAIVRAGNNWLNRLMADPPWGVTPWLKVGLLTLILALAMTAFLRNNARLRWLTLNATILYLGFIDGGFVSVVHIVNTINQGWDFLGSNLPLLLFILFTLLTTLLWGRIFCSSLCPFGAVQDFISRFAPKHWQRRIPRSIHQRGSYLKYGILALIVGAALFTEGISIYQYFEPFGTLFFLQGSPLLWLILAGLLAACTVVPRFYCRYVCPLGASLALLSLASLFRIRRVSQCETCALCENRCPTGAIHREKIDFKECVRCDVCEIKLEQQAGACRHEVAAINDRLIDDSIRLKPV